MGIGVRRGKSLSIFSGIGGLELAAEWAGIDPIAFCEIDSFCQSVLRKHWPHVPIFEDVRSLRGDQLGEIDIIYGGFPCQDVSLCGKRAGFVDSNGGVTRSGLWVEMCRLIREAQPRWVVAENVRGLLSISSRDSRRGGGFGTVLTDLAALGYRVGWCCYGASETCAMHQRERVFIVATPLASDGIAWTKNKKDDVATTVSKAVLRGGALRAFYPLIAKAYSPIQVAVFYETMMGFPERWTDLEA